MKQKEHTFSINHPLELNEGYTPMDIWFLLRSTDRMWKGTYNYLEENLALYRLEDTINYGKEKAELLKNIPKDRWFSLAQGEGWTPLACALYSWCAGASIDDVLSIWRQINYSPSLKPNQDYAASLINNEILPSLSLSSIIETGKDIIGTSIIIAARSQNPILDISFDNMQNMPQVLRDMINARS